MHHVRPEIVGAYKLFYHNKTKSKIAHFKLKVLVHEAVGLGKSHDPGVHSIWFENLTT